MYFWKWLKLKNQRSIYVQWPSIESGYNWSPFSMENKLRREKMNGLPEKSQSHLHLHFIFFLTSLIILWKNPFYYELLGLQFHADKWAVTKDPARVRRVQVLEVKESFLLLQLTKKSSMGCPLSPCPSPRSQKTFSWVAVNKNKGSINGMWVGNSLAA